jgi:hypothetical protein
MRNTTVFYDNQLLLEFDDPKEFETWRRACCVGNPEFYNGGYVYQSWISNDRKWYRMDLTPVLLEDVPPALRAWVLII